LLQNNNNVNDENSQHTLVVAATEGNQTSEVSYENLESSNELVLGQPSESYEPNSETFEQPSEGIGKL